MDPPPSRVRAGGPLRASPVLAGGTDTGADRAGPHQVRAGQLDTGRGAAPALATVVERQPVPAEGQCQPVPAEVQHLPMCVDRPVDPFLTIGVFDGRSWKVDGLER